MELREFVQQHEIEVECVMCGEEAEFIAPETKEPLCKKHNDNNNVIRHGKYLPPKFISIEENEQS